MASGHVSRIKRPNTWLHRPMLQNVKKALANSEPSTHGTFRTWPVWQTKSSVGFRAEVAFQGREVRFCRVGPGNFTPSLSQIPDVNLSIHPARATARRLPPSIDHRVPPVAG